jgi:hypothetical protein
LPLAPDAVLVRAAGDGGYQATWGMTGLFSMLMDPFPTWVETVGARTEFDGATCSLRAIEAIVYDSNGAPRGEQRDLLLRFSGDEVAGDGGASDCGSLVQVGAATVTGQRFDAGVGPNCPGPTDSTVCQPVGTWLISYGTTGEPSERLTIAATDGGFSFMLDAPAVDDGCGSAIALEQRGPDFNPLVCRMTLTQLDRGCNPPTSSEHRSLALDFHGDTALGPAAGHWQGDDGGSRFFCVTAVRQ